MFYIQTSFEGVEGLIAPMLQIKKHVFINHFFDCVTDSITEFAYKTFFKASVVEIKNCFFPVMLLFIQYKVHI